MTLVNLLVRPLRISPYERLNREISAHIVTASLLVLRVTCQSTFSAADGRKNNHVREKNANGSRGHAWMYKVVSASAPNPRGIHKVPVIRAVLDAGFFIRRLLIFVFRVLSLSASFFIRKFFPSSASF